MNNKKMRRCIKVVIVSMLIIITVLITAGSTYSKKVFNSISENVVRLHVIANSDSEKDQALKLKVRDAIIEYSQSSLNCYDSATDALQDFAVNSEEIKSVAERCLKEEGSAYEANVYVGEYEFPSKSYGNYCFPAGKYQAVRVVIGEGEGKNWWCVLFPPLCYMSENAVSVSEEAEKSLKQNLPEEAFSTIDGEKADEKQTGEKVTDLSGIDSGVHVTYKFRIVEIFQKIASLF